jgi:hypothetical protein
MWRRRRCTGTSPPRRTCAPPSWTPSTPTWSAASSTRLEERIVSLAAAADPGAPFAAALLLWSAWHGIVSLRLHKTDWDWGQTAEEANARIVTAMTRE